MRKLILIGASTGGPGHIKKIITQLNNITTESSFIIAQHMNKDILKSFVDQLSTCTKLPVYLVQDKKVIEPASIYVCNESLRFSSIHPLILESIDEETIYVPSIDTLFHSATKCLPDYGIIAIILTGIGDDGMLGIDTLYKKGALCIAESQSSAKVYGMPKAASEHNPNIEVMDIEDIVKFLHNV
ncbi:chemotaxis protein CheB [Sulfurimonas sediminis]|uniref:protein-glutamate methylesterase n=1 Tax=Sulfurimonas sediminis TaxID=2590020 RepID=A0A7M1B1K4_9BACT|nr:chemotaxis protein CheB [Sulfurimonas sediminis]QOP43396.1 chemotaxis protein CheB [Sulfurimonas sediminis]